MAIFHFLGPPSSPPIILLRRNIIRLMATTAVVQNNVTEKAKLCNQARKSTSATNQSANGLGRLRVEQILLRRPTFTQETWPSRARVRHRAPKLTLCPLVLPAAGPSHHILPFSDVSSRTIRNHFHWPHEGNKVATIDPGRPLRPGRPQTADLINGIRLAIIINQSN